MEKIPIVSLLQNAAMLLTLVMLFDLITSKRHISRKFFVQVVVGIVVGTLGIGIMLASFKLDEGVIFDTRSVLLSMSAVFFGLIPTLIAMIMTVVFRFYQGGLATNVGIMVILFTGSIGLIFRYFWKEKLINITPLKFYLFGILNHIVMIGLMFGLPLESAINVVKNIGLPVITIYPIATILIGMLMVNRLKRENLFDSLQESENRFRSLLEKAPEGIYVQIDGFFVFMNEAMLKLLDAKSKDELLGNKVMDSIAPEFHEAVFKRIAFQNETGNVASLMEQEYISLKGNRVSVETTASPIIYEGKKAHVIFLRDITKRKIDEEQIRKLSTAIEQSPISIVITDLNGVIEYCNPKFTDITGYSSAESIGKRPNVLKSGYTSDEKYKCLWETIQSGNVWKGEFKNIRKDGSYYWEFAHIAPVRIKNGEITHYIAIKEDISEKKMILEELIQAKNRAEEAQILKSHFLTNMSHEIRTPMNGILGFLELLKDVDLTSQQREEFISIVNKSGQRLLDTINDIIEMSRIEAGNYQLDLQETNLYETLNDLFNFFKIQAESKNIEIIPAFKHINKETCFLTDHPKFEGILTNLIKNAIKFTDKGFIELGANFDQDRLIIYVKDSGRGVPKDRQDAIFERFIQAELKNTRGHEGSGLGLAISKAYIELLGGKIWIESVEGEGSTFFCSFPYSQI